MAGTSGSAGERVALVTAIGRTRPERMNGRAVDDRKTRATRAAFAVGEKSGASSLRRAHGCLFLALSALATDQQHPCRLLDLTYHPAHFKVRRGPVAINVVDSLQAVTGPFV